MLLYAVMFLRLGGVVTRHINQFSSCKLTSTRIVTFRIAIKIINNLINLVYELPRI